MPGHPPSSSALRHTLGRLQLAELADELLALSVAGALQQRPAGKKDGLSQDADRGNKGGCSSAIRRAPAYYGREASRRQAQLSEPQRSGPCPGKRQDAARNCRCM
jgi:hypothetical protein